MVRHFFFHPDFTVGSGITPDQPSAKTGIEYPDTDGSRTAAKTAFTASRELHPTPKNLPDLISLPNVLCLGEDVKYGLLFFVKINIIKKRSKGTDNGHKKERTKWK